MDASTVNERCFPSDKDLANMPLTKLAEYYNQLITDFNLLDRYRIIQKFQNKTIAIERVSHLVWSLSMFVEKNIIAKELENMLSLKIDVTKISPKQTAAIIWEIFVTKELKIIKSSFIQLCVFAGIERNYSAAVWVDKCSLYNIISKDDRSSIVQIQPIGGKTKEFKKTKTTKKTIQKITKSMEEKENIPLKKKTTKPKNTTIKRTFKQTVSK